jgi:hypothetical protein
VNDLKGMKRRRLSNNLGGLDLIEQAVHALRQATPGALLCYYIGAAPFVLAAIWFFSEMSRSGLADQHLVGGAIGLTALFLWMKLWQSVFALKFSAQIASQPTPKISAPIILRALASQAFLHATGLFVIPVAANILVPIVWVFGFYQNATIFGLREPSLGALSRRSWKQACWALGQGHAALATLSLFSIFVFFNVAIAIIGAPHLLKILLGVESNTTLSVMSGFNTTFLAAAAGVTYLCVDPLFKAVFAMRCFHGEARTTGEDLRVTLRSFQSPALALILLLLIGVTTSPVLGADKASRTSLTLAAFAQPPATDSGTHLDRSIDEVLQNPKYTWREPRVKKDRAEDDAESAMWVRVKAWLKKNLRAFETWLENLFKRQRGLPGGGWNFRLSSEGFVYILIAVVAVIVGLLLWFLWRSRSRASRVGLEATPAAPMPDLTSDDVSGNELPVDGWTALALELLERGELRLAMRAFYFSSLAHLATRSLVNIAKFKSNRDYERELLRRSHALPGLTQSFSDNVSIFDRVWYGRHDINGELIQQFRGNVERIREC